MDHVQRPLELPRVDLPWDIINRWKQMVDRLEEQQAPVRRPRRIVVDKMNPFQA